MTPPRRPRRPDGGARVIPLRGRRGHPDPQRQDPQRRQPPPAQGRVVRGGRDGQPAQGRAQPAGRGSRAVPPGSGRSGQQNQGQQRSGQQRSGQQRSGQRGERRGSGAAAARSSTAAVSGRGRPAPGGRTGADRGRAGTRRTQPVRRAGSPPARRPRSGARPRGAPAPARNSRRPVRRRRPIRLGNPRRRLRGGLAAFCALLLVLGGRLVQLQGVDSGQYAAAAVSDRTHVYDLPARRGQILDRDGNVLATSVDAKIIFADPKLVKDEHATAEQLAPLLHRPVAEVQARLSRHGRYVELARGMTPQDAQRIMDLDLAGIGEDPQQQRLYPAGQVGANVVGFTNREGVGSAGVEARFDSYLAGRPGTLVAEVGRDGQIITSGVHRQVDAVPGSSVRLTLSEDLQYVAQTELDAAVRAHGARGGQVAVLDAHTGEVLALAVSPSSRDGRTLLTDPAVSDVFEPGSANKVVTFAAAVEQGLITPDTVLQVPGSIRVSDRYVHDAWSHGPVNYTATGVLAKSSNVGTLMIAQRLGEQRFYDYLRRFGLGQRTGIELPGESRGILPPIDQWSGTTFGNLPIGQGVSMTILQLASMYQTVANDGVRVPPRLVSAFVDADGRTHAQKTPAGTRVLSPRTAQTVRYMLEAVTHKGGTAPSAAIDGYRVAGKTGTAQQPDPRCRCYTDRYWATFAGMAPADDPRLVVAVMVDDASGGQHGGQAAGPLFRTVMTYALKQRGIPPTGSPQPTFRLIAD